MKREKKQAWLNYCEQTNENYGNLYKYVSKKILRHDDLIFTCLENSVPFSTYNDVAHQLMLEQFGIDELPANAHEYISTINHGADLDFIPVTNREIKHAIGQQSISKAPGPDNIDAIVVKNLCNVFPEVIRAILNLCLSLSHFPYIWKAGMVIFFRKRNKNPLSPRGYRPITLLSMLGKLLERISN